LFQQTADSPSLASVIALLVQLNGTPAAAAAAMTTPSVMSLTRRAHLSASAGWHL